MGAPTIGDVKESMHVCGEIWDMKTQDHGMKQQAWETEMHF